MTRRTAVLMVAVLALAGGLGCTDQPLVTDVLGFFPGPPPSLVQQATLNSQLLAQGVDLNDLAALLGAGGQASATTGLTGSGGDDTPSATGGSEECPAGQVWVSTVIMGVAINQCLSEDQAAQLGL